VDISKLLGAINSIPREKLRTDSGLKEVIRELAKKGGKKLSDKELDGYVAQFRSMQKTESAGSLLNKLAKKGVNPNDLSAIKKKFRK
jgi:hypothetical protein